MTLQPSVLNNHNHPAWRSWHFAEERPTLQAKQDIKLGHAGNYFLWYDNPNGFDVISAVIT